jgi:hypothetical protein
MIPLSELKLWKSTLSEVTAGRIIDFDLQNGTGA